MPFEPHQESAKTPEELAQQREVRLRIRMANAYLKEGAVEKALGYMLSVLEMENVAHKTRTRVAQSILANAGRVGDRGPQVTVDARSQQLTIADLARLTPGTGPIGLEAPNSGSVVSPALQAGGLAPTPELQDMHRLLELQFAARSQVTPSHVDGSDADGLGLSGPTGPTSEPSDGRGQR